MVELLASAIIWLTGPVGIPLPPTPSAYTCSTDYECEQECIARGDTNCTDWGIIPEDD